MTYEINNKTRYQIVDNILEIIDKNLILQDLPFIWKSSARQYARNHPGETPPLLKDTHETSNLIKMLYDDKEFMNNTELNNMDASEETKKSFIYTGIHLIYGNGILNKGVA